jgi:hypothetical protein
MRPPARLPGEIVQDIAAIVPRPLRCDADDLPAKTQEMLDRWKKETPTLPIVTPAMARARAVRCRKLIQELKHELGLFPIPPITFSPLVAALNDADAGLERMISKGGLKIPSSIEKHSAQCAASIIVELSKRRPTGTPDGPLYRIAPLAYEYFTGEKPRSLKRAIDAEVKSRR